MVGQDISRDVAVAGDDIEHARGKAGFLDKGSDFGRLVKQSASTHALYQ